MFSKKSQNVINIISTISMVGVGICSAALVIVLSAFNGIESLVDSYYSAFDSDIRITAMVGKTFARDSFPEDKVYGMNGVAYYSEVVEESVVLQYDGQQAIPIMKGVEEDFLLMSGLDTMLEIGRLKVEQDGYQMAMPGIGVAYKLGIYLSQPCVDDFRQCPNIVVNAPIRGKKLMKEKEGAFNERRIVVPDVFSTKMADIDEQYILVPIAFAREMLGYENDISAIEIGLEPDVDPMMMKHGLAEILGPNYEIKTRYEQNETIFKTHQTEKWMTFLILSFILVIATFNIVASLTMLVIDKKKDIEILMSMGATRKAVHQIFFLEGLLINLVGGIAGLLLGFLLCLLQWAFGLIKLENGIVPYYPVEMHVMDFVLVFMAVFVIGLIASWLPVRYLTRRHF